MSIRFKILLPMIALAIGGLVLSGLQMWFSTAQNAQAAALVANAMQAGEMAREAREGFDALNDVVAEVTAMTHFVEPESVSKRFGDSVLVVGSRLGDLKRNALSPEMERLADEAAAGFEAWRRDAAVVLGVERAVSVPVADELSRKRSRLKQQFVQATDLAAEDARRGIAEIDARQRFTMRLMLAFALAFGAAASFAAWRLAVSLSRPILALVAGADRLARGDVSVTFEGTDRRDEIGGIARAIAAFRDNVGAAQSAEATAASERQAAEIARRQSESLRATTSEEQARVVTELSNGLERLAKGDLTCRVEGEFSPNYERLKTNFNKSLDVLQEALAAIGEGARELQAGSSEIAGLAADISSRTGAQTASIQEAAAALEEITTTVRATADNAGQARGVVSKTRGEAEKSGAVVRTAVEAIGRIQQSSQQIEKIIGVIDEIAFQTNLLALNAGVEAARAGESGRGFAVVASEVRALAQRSADASKEIKSLISLSSAHVKDGVDLVVSAGSALDRIFAQVSEIDRVVETIAGGAAEQSTGLQSVNKGVSDIDRVNQSNVSIVERTTSACANVADRATELAQAVAMFKVEHEIMTHQRQAA
jgi:methyl-accepting chemotaxis protein